MKILEEVEMEPSNRVASDSGCAESDSLGVLRALGEDWEWRHLGSTLNSLGRKDIEESVSRGGYTKTYPLPADSFDGK